MPGQEIQLIFKMFFGFVIFACLLFLVYVTTKFIGQKASGVMRGNHMKVIETLSLGFDKTIYLIEVGGEYLLFSSSGKSIKFLKQVDIEKIQEISQEKPIGSDFYKFLSDYIKKIAIGGNKPYGLDDNGKVDKNSKMDLSRLKKVSKEFRVRDRDEDESFDD